MNFSKYGLIQFPVSIVEVYLRLYLLVYLTQEIQLSGGWASVIVSGSLIISTFFDSYIGRKIDFLTTEKEIKKPIYFGFSLMSLTLLLLFIPNWTGEDIWTLFIIALVYQIAYSLIFLPYMTMSKLILKKQEDIISLHAWRLLWGSLGAILGVGLPLTLSFLFDDYYNQLCLILVILLTVLAPLILSKINITSSLPMHTEISKTNYFLELRELFKNKTFIPFLFYFIFLSVGLGLNQTLSVYYYREGLLLTEQQTYLLLGFFLLVFSLSLPLWTFLGKKRGEKSNIIIALVGIICVTFSYPYLSKNHLIILYTVIIIGGVFSAVVCLNDPYLSKIIDYHAFKYRKKRSNFIFGVWRTFDKLSRSLGIYFAGLIIDMTLKKTTPNIIGLDFKTLYSYAIVFFFLPALVSVLWIKLKPSKHLQLINYLKKKKPGLLFSTFEI